MLKTKKTAYSCAISYPQYGEFLNTLCSCEYSAFDPDVCYNLFLTVLEYSKFLNSNPVYRDKKAIKWCNENISKLFGFIWDGSGYIETLLKLKNDYYSEKAPNLKIHLEHSILLKFNSFIDSVPNQNSLITKVYIH
ncbi:hypothetical protein AYI69_g3301 [Smittium culicis]|uniref:Uncharacterized protein n=1 Tax=Smittium culicis TaxID=133412 RepID=A0A1R1YK69_9FUNG|nr:hypothetical protein AYI69_g3301 [Smittium culicis]